MSTVAIRGYHATKGRPLSPGPWRKLSKAMTKFIWLPLAHLRYHFRRALKASGDKVPGILRLPNEIVLEVIGFLKLHDLFILSQTCRALRAFAWRDWDLTVNQMHDIHYTDFLVGITYVRPNKWVCGRCGKLHAIEKRDLPWSRLCIRNSLPLCHHDKGIKCGPVYELRHIHVQMALKLTRMGNINQKYLRQIMKPYSDERHSLIRSKVLLRTRAIPKIVAERFLLHAEYEYRDGTAPVSPETLRLERICPHMMIWPYRRTGSNRTSRALGLEGLSDAVHLAFDRPGQEVPGHCHRCPTDYTVVASTSVLMIRAWHDLGSYTSPRDERWMENIWSNGNAPWKGLTAHHNLGSARNMYALGVETRTVD